MLESRDFKNPTSSSSGDALTLLPRFSSIGTNVWRTHSCRGLRWNHSMLTSLQGPRCVTETREDEVISWFRPVGGGGGGVKLGGFSLSRFSFALLQKHRGTCCSGFIIELHDHRRVAGQIIPPQGLGSLMNISWLKHTHTTHTHCAVHVELRKLSHYTAAWAELVLTPPSRLNRRSLY